MRSKPTSFARSGPRHRLFAWAWARGSPHYEPLVDEHKRRLFANVSGTVVEIGPGAGANLRLFPPHVRWIGVEPNVHMHAYLKREARDRNVSVDLRTGTAEHTGLDDGVADVVVSTLVLCSVDDPARALAEVRRILKPGGPFIFLEHVAAPPRTALRLLQRAIRAPWQCLADGCHPDRDTLAAIEAAGFERVEYERFRVPVPIVSPHVAGVAYK